MKTKSHHMPQKENLSLLEMITAKTIEEASFVFIHPYMHTFDSHSIQ